MKAMHTIFDHLLFALLLILPLIEWRWTWPRFLARLASGQPDVRWRFYRGVVFSQWTVVLALMAYWIFYRRPWVWLLLGTPPALRFACGMAIGLLGVAFLYWQRLQILRRHEATAQAMRQLESAAPLLPHRANENRMFKVVSVTAGVCEEILFRGFLLWYFTASAGTAVAVILSSLVFGLGHIYMGASQVPKTAGAGMVMACLAIASGSLWPAILIHAAADWNSGEVGYRLLGNGLLKDANAKLLSQS
jgi:membrane protease YdiL (CAAX protease family)